jgi:hypothetical protein
VLFPQFLEHRVPVELGHHVPEALGLRVRGLPQMRDGALRDPLPARVEACGGGVEERHPGCVVGGLNGSYNAFMARMSSSEFITNVGMSCIPLISCRSSGLSTWVSCPSSATTPARRA